MTIIELLGQQVRDTRATLIGTTQDITEEVAHWQPPGTAHSIAATWAHAIFIEDLITNQILQSSQPLYQSQWRDRTGVNKLQPQPGDNWEEGYAKWAQEAKIMLDQFREYNQAVFAATDSFLNSVTAVDVIKMIDATAIGMGQRAMYSVISNGIIAHTDNIVGEISALKGVQGFKGYPW